MATPKTIDERLDALTQSVELMSRMQMKTDKELRRFMRFTRLVLFDYDERISTLEGKDPLLDPEEDEGKE